MGEGDGRCERCGSDGEAKEAMEAMGSGRVAPTGPLTPFGESFSKGGGGKGRESVLGQATGTGKRFFRLAPASQSIFAGVRMVKNAFRLQERFPRVRESVLRFQIGQPCRFGSRPQGRKASVKGDSEGVSLASLPFSLSHSLAHSTQCTHARTHATTQLSKKKCHRWAFRSSIFNRQPRGEPSFRSSYVIQSSG
jgi:hypothetical protein